MLQETDAAELRALQAKAYGRHGGLTEPEGARLRALESMRAAAPVRMPDEASGADGSIVVDSVDVPLSIADTSLPAGDARGEDETEDETAENGRSADDPVRPAASGTLAAFRQHWKTAAAASVAVLLIGFGAGWALFGQSGGVALTPEQQERRAELQADGDFDPGTLRAIGQDDDALVWYATKDDGDLVCLTIDVADASADQCTRAEELVNGGGAGVSIIPAAEGSGDGPSEQIWATATQAMNGEIVAIIQRWNVTQDDWLSQFDGEERDRAEQLVDEGFEQYSFSVVGYVEDAPVWYGQRVDGIVPQDCLVVDALDATQCVNAGDAQSTKSGIGIAGTTVDDAGIAAPWSVMLAFTPSGTPYLVIDGDVPSVSQKEKPGQTVKPGETLELGGEYQDPIQVEVPSDSSDG